MKRRILIIAMVFTTILGLFGCGGGSKKAVVSVESMTLTLRGMRGGAVYKFEDEGDRTELRKYREVYSNDKNELVLESSTVCDAQRMTELMNTCGVVNWDGFHGKHPKNVSDGIMFDLTATVNGDLTVHAEGSANFPKGYHEFVNTLDTMLADKE